MHLGFGLRCLDLRLARTGCSGFILRRLRLLVLSALHDLLACVDGAADCIGEALLHRCADAAHCCNLREGTAEHARDAVVRSRGVVAHVLEHSPQGAEVQEGHDDVERADREECEHGITEAHG